ncbi:hypothetical protein DER46DRAFT_394765 [Fusarium sp. MPI-SDFR-AT-0072]|nr:hypothetical protein DER46DRAFT_394765 [Fusarium sp. MPI-SDFR-AT-0072]
MGQQRLVIEGSARGKVNSALRLGHVLRRRDLTKLPGRIFAKSVLLVSLLLWLQTRIGVLLLVVGYGERKKPIDTGMSATGWYAIIPLLNWVI